ncbi:MAG: DUF4783 domain-containing protein [Ignavibacteria bacterium]
MSSKLAILFSFMILLTIPAESYSQDSWWKEKKFKTENAKKKYELCKKTFKEISNGFSYGSVSLISKYFNGEVFLDIMSNEKGYYSTGQAEYIVSDFIDYFKVTSVKLINSYYKNSYAFVMGKYSYNIGSGKRELKLSVSLKYQNYSWYIDQINLN